MVAGGRSGERGGALILVVVVSILIVGIGAAFMALTAATTEQTSRDALGLQALYCAETGIAVAVGALNAGTLPLDGSGDGADGVLNPINYGAAGMPTQDTGMVSLLTGNLGTGRYEVTIALWGFDRDWLDVDTDGDTTEGVDNNGDGNANEGGEANYMTVTARGIIDGNEGKQIVRVIEVVIGRGVEVFGDKAIAARGTGNTVNFKGNGKDADYVEGDVYINGNVNVSQQADLNGNLKAAGSVTGWSNWEQGTEGFIDYATKNYPANHDVNIATAFAPGAPGLTYGPSYGGNSLGGNAYQLPQSNPAHIFRKNPSDRTSVYTQYDNVWALEDPGERLQNDANWNGTDATKISFTSGFEYGKVYYVDEPGKKDVMIIDNTSTYSYKFNTPGAEATGQQVVIVVKGDIVIGDNIFMTNQNKDAVVFIALKNDDGTGGNIYYGDPRYGTVEDFNAYMFAENNFISTNVNYNNSKILVHGNMEANNKIIMNLDTSGTPVKHHKWEVIHDKRLSDTIKGVANGASSLDGLVDVVPNMTTQGAVGDYVIMSWAQKPPKTVPSPQGYSY